MKPQYEGSATRSDVKPEYHLVNPQFERLVAEAMTLGKQEHGEWNYRTGGPEFIKGCYAHLREHLANLIEAANLHTFDADYFDEMAEHIGHAAANLNILTYFLYRDHHLDALAEAGLWADQTVFQDSDEEEILETSPKGIPVPAPNPLKKLFDFVKGEEGA